MNCEDSVREEVEALDAAPKLLLPNGTPSQTTLRANQRQIGGDHYKVGGEEHWDRVARLGLDYFQGQITKYVERWKKKGGLADLRKAEHFLQKYIEIEEAKAWMAEYDPLGKMEAGNGGTDKGVSEGATPAGPG
jgi:hypothetical protein